MENEKENIKKRRGSTRHCSYGLCRSDTRYKEKEYMQGVTWIPFPKPHKDLEKCKKWVRACGRMNFTHENVKKWTYICSRHFVNETGPTEEHPDPIPASFTPLQVTKLSNKRKAPTPRANPVSKKLILDASEALLSLRYTKCSAEEQPCAPEKEGQRDELPEDQRPTKVLVDASVNTCQDTLTQGTQTTFICKNELASKINLMVQKRREVKVEKPLQDSFSYEKISENKKMFKFYTGLTVLQFTHLFSCFGKEPFHLNYWRGNKTTPGPSLNRKVEERKLSPINQFFLTLVKLRQAFPHQDLAYRFEVSVSTVSVLINTWIQYLYKKTERIRIRQFPSKHMIKRNLPPCFNSFKNVRAIIDCFEIYIQSARNFEEQGNMYSSYKNHTTLKCLVAISPCGGISFLSDTFEGGISDREIFVKSQMVNFMEPGDLVIADRGFLIKDILQQHNIELNIPPFLNGRTRLTAEEEILTKRIARVRIHVERAIERMKKFKIIGKKVPLVLKPVVSQMVHVIGFLVNYQDPIVK